VGTILAGQEQRRSIMTALLVLVAAVFAGVTGVAVAVIGWNASAIRREDHADTLTDMAPDRATQRARRLNGLYVRGTHGPGVGRAADVYRSASTEATAPARNVGMLV
jgi:hypothetical protein